MPIAKTFWRLSPASLCIELPTPQNGLFGGALPSSLSRSTKPVRCASSGSGAAELVVLEDRADVAERPLAGRRRAARQVLHAARGDRCRP
jgi:hypothetical protein